MVNKTGSRIGKWAFLIGVVLAVVFGVVGVNEKLSIVLMVIGLAVGLLNVTDRETMPFLMSGAVLVIVSSLGQTGMQTITQVEGIFNALLIIFVPATVIVAIKNVFSIAKN